MDYQDFVVRIEADPGGATSRVLRSPAGESERTPLRIGVGRDDLARLAGVIEASVREPPRAGLRHLLGLGGAPPPAPEPAEVGHRLFQGLFVGEVRDRFLVSLERAQAAGRGLRLLLRFHLGDGAAVSSVAELHRLPWELLYRRETGHFLGLSRSTVVVRYLEGEAPADRPRRPAPLVVLAVTAQPRGFPGLDLETERRSLERCLSARRVEVRVLEHATLEDLVEALRPGDIHVLHFMGHGDVTPETGDGVLLLEDGRGGPETVSGERLARQLRDFMPGLRLAFLNACRTGDLAVAAPFAGVATALVRAGLGAVVAMQFPVSDRAATLFSGELYRHVARGLALDGAVSEGRLAIDRGLPGSPEWATPALFLRVADGRLFVGAGGEEDDSKRTTVPRGSRRRRLLRLAGAATASAGLGLAGLAGLQYLPRDPGEPAAVGNAAEGAPTTVPESASPPRDATEPEEELADATPSRSPPAVPAIRELPDGEPVRFPKARAWVTASFIQLQGRELVRLTVDPDDGEVQRVVTFGSETRHFPVGDEVLSLQVSPVDWRARRVAVRASRCAASEPACGPDSVGRP